MGSDEINRLNEAYLKALQMLDLTDRNDPIREIVAMKIINVGRSGVINPEEIAEAVVGHFLKT